MENGLVQSDQVRLLACSGFLLYFMAINFLSLGCHIQVAICVDHELAAYPEFSRNLEILHIHDLGTLVLLVSNFVFDVLSYPILRIRLILSTVDINTAQ